MLSLLCLLKPVLGLHVLRICALLEGALFQTLVGEPQVLGNPDDPAQQS